jgi:hypothetical protein
LIIEKYLCLPELTTLLLLGLGAVMVRSGHASPATTANMYADISFEDMQSGINGLYE